MSSLKIKECKGFTKDEAFANLDFIPHHQAISGANCTQAWNKAGRPLPGTKDFKIFAVEQLAEKTKNAPGFGLYIVLDSPSPDTRRRPYSIINNVVDGTREWTFKYLIFQADIICSEFPITSTDDNGDIIKEGTFIEPTITKYGEVVEIVDSKAEAFARVKDLTSENRKSYAFYAVKVPDKMPIAGYSIYTPAQGTKIGTFIAFGYNEE